jgi:hypothetical protein
MFLPGSWHVANLLVLGGYNWGTFECMTLPKPGLIPGQQRTAARERIMAAVIATGRRAIKIT